MARSIFEFRGHRLYANTVGAEWSEIWFLFSVAKQLRGGLTLVSYYYFVEDVSREARNALDKSLLRYEPPRVLAKADGGSPTLYTVDQVIGLSELIPIKGNKVTLTFPQAKPKENIFVRLDFTLGGQTFRCKMQSHGTMGDSISRYATGHLVRHNNNAEYAKSDPWKMPEGFESPISNLKPGPQKASSRKR